MLAKNRINRNKTDNKVKSDNKNLDFMPFIQNNINCISNGNNRNKYVFAIKPLIIVISSDFRVEDFSK